MKRDPKFYRYVYDFAVYVYIGIHLNAHPNYQHSSSNSTTSHQNKFLRSISLFKSLGFAKT